MSSVTRIVLDVLKPRHPNAIDFACVIADRNNGCRVTMTVTEVDEKTESTMVVIESKTIDYNAIVDAITSLGGSVHSIDEVEVTSLSPRGHKGALNDR
ncbi:MAG: DUF211 domain-containing protein [Gammaproteobacteria bacterium]